MRVHTGFVALLLTSACAGPNPADEVHGISYRIEDGPIQQAESFTSVHAAVTQRKLEAWIDVPHRTCDDPALLLPEVITLDQAEIGERRIDVRTRPYGLIPLGREPNARVHLVF